MGYTQALLHLLLLFFSLTTYGSENFLFRSTSCPEINSSEFQSESLLEGKNQLHVFWKKENESPYAAYIPDAFRIAAIQIQEELEKQSISDLAPATIELYSFGRSLPGTLTNFTAILCKSQQTESTMRLLVNDNFLTHAITFKQKLSHELFHFITAKLKKTYPHWLEEGLAMQFESLLTGKEDLTNATFHLENSPWMPLEPNLSLKHMDHKRSFYGHAHLFVRYLYKKSPELFLSNLLHSPHSDPNLLFSDFNEQFKEFSIAKYVNTFDFFGETLEDRERFILIDGVRVNKNIPGSIITGRLSATTKATGLTRTWISLGSEIEISSRPRANAFAIYITY